ncbi:hypothetical protein H8S95_01805 [Pontibacter sp. KCTC 32443]|uniref:hypothetical protein n=1 Tax=Pontibacter TaxID=323449 RepID=UPI00164D4BB9|nr:MULTISPECIES: hypothetical protein [Pontibacter]MBC5772784.1 hypothetical protein [Pontibacter sp. KCTC 32443]
MNLSKLYKGFVITCIALIPSSSIGQALPQNLSLQNLITVYNKSSDFSAVDSYLLNKNWSLEAIKNLEGTPYANWHYLENEEEVASLLVLENNNTTIYYKFNNSKIRDALKAEIVSLKMKLVSSEVINNSMTSTYLGANFAVKLSTLLIDGKPIYALLLKSKEQYYTELNL